MKLLLGSFLGASAAALSFRGTTLDASLFQDGHNKDNLEDTLLGLLSQGNTPALQQFVKQIRAMLDGSMKPQVLKHRDEEQDRLDSLVTPFRACSAGLKKAANTTSSAVSTAKRLQGELDKAQADLVKLQAEEKSCLDSLKVYTDLKNAVCSNLAAVTKTSNPCGCSASAASYISDLTTISKCFADQLSKAKDLDAKCTDATKKLTAEKPKCDATTAAVVAKKGDVATLKSQVDGASCDAYTKGKQACDTGASCHSKATKDFDAAVAAAKLQEAGMKSEWESLGRMSCLADVFNVEDDKRAKAIQACKEEDVDTSKLTLKYPKVPAADACAVPAGVKCGVSEGLLAYYPLNSNCKDASGNGRDASDFGARPQAAGSYFGGGTNCQGSWASSYNWGSALSVCARFKRTADNGKYMGIVTNGYYNSGGWEIRMGREGCSSGSCNMLGGGVSTGVSPNTWDVHSVTAKLNTWVHTCFTYDGSSFTFYKDGTSVSTSAADKGAIVGKGKPLFIGIADSGSHESFDGLIQHVRVYNKALSASDVFQIYSTDI